MSYLCVSLVYLHRDVLAVVDMGYIPKESSVGRMLPEYFYDERYKRNSKKFNVYDKCNSFMLMTCLLLVSFPRL